jgi:hypothetical protein
MKLFEIFFQGNPPDLLDRKPDRVILMAKGRRLFEIAHGVSGAAELPQVKTRGMQELGSGGLRAA